MNVDLKGANLQDRFLLAPILRCAYRPDLINQPIFLFFPKLTVLVGFQTFYICGVLVIKVQMKPIIKNIRMMVKQVRNI
jgi:hypothetical protein